MDAQYGEELYFRQPKLPEFEIDNRVQHFVNGLIEAVKTNDIKRIQQFIEIRKQHMGRKDFQKFIQNNIAVIVSESLMIFKNGNVEIDILNKTFQYLFDVSIGETGASKSYQISKVLSSVYELITEHERISVDRMEIFKNSVMVIRSNPYLSSIFRMHIKGILDSRSAGEWKEPLKVVFSTLGSNDLSFDLAETYSNSLDQSRMFYSLDSAIHHIAQQIYKNLKNEFAHANKLMMTDAANILLLGFMLATLLLFVAMMFAN